ncbi:MAG TPA: VCBS repeat-containing protein, partial [Thermoanaerobaculia bacterium]|nr:VCBS repeat-containing protein [Thermoanaerobaculia bacterium]
MDRHGAPGVLGLIPVIVLASLAGGGSAAALADGRVAAAVPAAVPAATAGDRTGAKAAGADRERWFEDVTKRAGLAVAHHNRVFHNPYAEIMAGYTALGAAAAAADYDGDGFEDLFVTDSSEGGRNHLYHNNGDLTFTDVAEAAGVAAGNDAENATADAIWFDYNNDGRPDLFVVRFGHSQLF